MDENPPAPLATTDGEPEAGRSPTDWPAIRHIYEKDLGVTLEGICARFGISKQALRKKVEGEGWTPRRARPIHRARGKVVRVSRGTLIARMLGALERQITRLEETEMPPTDKEVVLLGSMSRTLGKLMDINKGRKRSSKAKAPASAELSELRKKIAERIDQLNQG